MDKLKYIHKLLEEKKFIHVATMYENVVKINETSHQTIAFGAEKLINVADITKVELTTLKELKYNGYRTGKEPILSSNEVFEFQLIPGQQIKCILIE